MVARPGRRSWPRRRRRRSRSYVGWIDRIMAAKAEKQALGKQAYPRSNAIHVATGETSEAIGVGSIERYSLRVYL